MKNITRTIEKTTLYGTAYYKVDKTLVGFAAIGYESTDDEIIKEYERLNPDKKVVDVDDKETRKIKLTMPIDNFVAMATEINED